MEPKVGDSIFNQDGSYATEIRAIISHHPFRVFGRDGGRYLIEWTNASNGPTNIKIVAKNNYNAIDELQNAEMFYKSELEIKQGQPYEWLIMLLDDKGNWLGLGHAEDKTPEQLAKRLYSYQKENRKIKKIKTLARTLSSEQFFMDCEEIIKHIKETTNKELE